MRAYVEPNTTRNLATGPIPSHVIDVLKIAAQSDEALEQWSQELNMPRQRLVDIAVFFIEQVLMTRDASYYRVLGVNPDAPQARLRSHYQWLMRWLHPDGPRAGWHGVLAHRVTVAYNTLKDPDKRAAYDATLRLPGTSHLRSTVPVLNDVVDEEDLEHTETDVLPESVAHQLPPHDTDATPGLPTLTEKVAGPAPVHNPMDLPPPVWVPERIAATGRWKQPAPPRSLLRYVIVAGVLLAAVIGLGLWLKTVKPSRQAMPVTTASAPAETPPPVSTPPAEPASEPAAAPPQTGAPTPSRPTASPPPVAAVAQSSAPSPRTTPPAEAASQPAPAVSQVRAKARPAAPPPVITETPPKPRRAAPPPANTAAEPAPAVAEQASAPPVTPTPEATPALAPARPPAAPAINPAALATAEQVGDAYAKGDFLTVLNLLNRGGRASSQNLASTAESVQNWSRDRGGQALAVAGAQALQPAADGAEPREEIVLRAADGARLHVVLRQLGSDWQVERITPEVPASAATGPGQ